MAWSPMAGGLLAKKQAQPKDNNQTSGEESHKAEERVSLIIAEIGAIAQDLDTEPSTVAVGWAIAKGMIPVIGPRNRTQLSANLAAAAIQLTEEQIDRLDEASTQPQGYPYDLLQHARAKSGIESSRLGQIL